MQTIDLFHSLAQLKSKRAKRGRAVVGHSANFAAQDDCHDEILQDKHLHGIPLRDWVGLHWPRLAAELVASPRKATPDWGTLRWSLRLALPEQRATGAHKGRLNPVLQALPTLTLQLDGHFYMPCQRCCEAVLVEVNIPTVHTYLVCEPMDSRDESLEAAAERLATDPFLGAEVEVLPCSRHFDLDEYVEEAILLSLPMLQLHDECDPAALVSLQQRLAQANRNQPQRERAQAQDKAGKQDKKQAASHKIAQLNRASSPLARQQPAAANPPSSVQGASPKSSPTNPFASLAKLTTKKAKQHPGSDQGE
ncbi:YceD family protein [Parvibium lacunae]|uniref:YceD family protein n=1 Tax=Parvibium lacunae TaxID=1888893 RepID=UPI0011C0373E|nr:YceD family protein [Parvibium lacunae]